MKLAFLFALLAGVRVFPKSTNCSYFSVMDAPQDKDPRNKVDSITKKIWSYENILYIIFGIPTGIVPPSPFYVCCGYSPLISGSAIEKRFLTQQK